LLFVAYSIILKRINILSLVIMLLNKYVSAFFEYILLYVLYSLELLEMAAHGSNARAHARGFATVVRVVQ